MSLPKLIELNGVDFVTIDAIGSPGERTFFLQAAQEDTLVTLIIEKEHAAALSIAIQGILEQLGGPAGEHESANPDLVHPVKPLFRVGRLGLGYDEARDMLIIMAESLATEESPQVTRVRLFANRVQMAALARKAAIAVTSGRPVCMLCDEPINPGEEHVCVKGNGRKWIYELDGD